MKKYTIGITIEKKDLVQYEANNEAEAIKKAYIDAEDRYGVDDLKVEIEVLDI
jgi:hypothetical protein